MIIVGQASAAATSVAIPAHQVGDMIIVAARAASNTTPGTPAATGTVPAWAAIQVGAGANTLALKTVYFIATATNHTTGAFSGASHVAALVLRADVGKAIALGGSAFGNANNTATCVYPALALTTTDGSSMGVRAAVRAGTAVAAFGNAPTNWINQTKQPATPLLVVHTRSALAANPVADTVSGLGANAACRAHTIEITETAPPAGPTYEDSIDDFNRADDKLDAAGTWVCTWLNSTDPTDLRVIGNRLGSTVATWQPAYSKVEIDNSSGDCDVLIDCIATPVAPNNEWGFYPLLTGAGTAAQSGYGIFFAAGTWILRRYLNATNQGNIATVAGSLSTGDTIWFSKRGSALKVYVKHIAGGWSVLLSGTDANHNPAKGAIGIELSDTTQRWDNLRGGPLVSAAPAPKIVSIF